MTILFLNCLLTFFQIDLNIFHFLISFLAGSPPIFISNIYNVRLVLPQVNFLNLVSDLNQETCMKLETKTSKLVFRQWGQTENFKLTINATFRGLDCSKRFNVNIYVNGRSGSGWGCKTPTVSCKLLDTSTSYATTSYVTTSNVSNNEDESRASGCSYQCDCSGGACAGDGIVYFKFAHLDPAEFCEVSLEIEEIENEEATIGNYNYLT